MEVAVTPSGKSAYVVGHNAISQFSIDPPTGNLIAKSPSTVATGRNAEAIAISSDGRYVYVSNCPGCVTRLKGSRPPSPSRAPTANIWEYRVNPRTGTLTRVGAVATGTGANAIAITPDGRSLYVAVAAVARTVVHPEAITLAPDGRAAYVTSENDGELSQFDIDPATGRIAPMPPATVSTGSGSLGLAISSGAGDVTPP